jgi:hypothetical protein
LATRAADDLVIEDSDSEEGKNSDDEVERTGLSVILRKNKLDHWGEEEEDNDFLDGLESTCRRSLPSFARRQLCLT